MHACICFCKNFFLVSDTNESATCRLQKKQKKIRFYKFKKEKAAFDKKTFIFFYELLEKFFLVSDTNESASCRLPRTKKKKSNEDATCRLQKDVTSLKLLENYKKILQLFFELQK